MGSLLLFYLICALLLSAGCVFAAARWGLRYEEALPISLTALMLLLFLFGAAGLLEAGVWAICLLALLLYAASFRLAAGKLKALAGKVFTPAALLFLLTLAGLFYINYGREVRRIDEMTHWADTVKAMYYTGLLPSAGAAATSFPAYPPGMALPEYLFLRLYALIGRDAGYTEWVMYAAYQSFLLAFLFPFLRGLDFKKPLRLILAAAMVLMCPLMMDASEPYCSLYIDPFLCAALGGGLAAVFTETEKDRLCYDLYVYSACAFLVLAKPAGLLFSFFLAAAYAAELLLRSGENRGRRLALAAGSVLVPLGVWTLRKAIDGVTQSFSSKEGAVDLRLALRYALHREGESWQQIVHDDYYRRLLTDTVRIKGFACPYWLLLLISAAALYALIRLTDRRRGHLRAARRLVLPALAVMAVSYYVSLCYVYIFKFGWWEAVVLAQFDRYVGILLYAVYTAALLAFVRFFTETDQSVGSVCAALAVFALLSPFGRALDVARRTDIAVQDPVYTEYRALVKELDRLSDGQPVRLCRVSQGDTGGSSTGVCYLLRPHTTVPTGEWFLGPAPEMPWADAFADRELSAEDWMRELREGYDYLYLEHIDDYFLEHYAGLFAPGSEPAEKGLYRVGEQLTIIETEGFI